MLTFFKRYGLRGFSNSSFRANLEKATPPQPPSEQPTSSSTGGVTSNFVPNNFEKKLLIWSGKYKSVSEIPARISYDTLDRARSLVRIKLAYVLMAGTLVLCGYYVWKGKKDFREGRTVHKIYEEQKRMAMQHSENSVK